jgi:hypothetical protein
MQATAAGLQLTDQFAVHGVAAWSISPDDSLVVGMSLKLTGWLVIGLMTEGFLIFHARAFSGAAMRMAA